MKGLLGNLGDFNWQEGDQSDGRRKKAFGRGAYEGIFGLDRCGQLLLGSR